MRAVEFISEAFDKPYKGKWEKSDYGDIDVNAKLLDGTYLNIMFNQEHDGEGDEVVQVEFHRNNSQEVTGEGDAQRIFATVLNAIQKYIKKYKPQKISFSANKSVDMDADDNGVKFNPESRAKLYTRLVQRYASAWGYQANVSDEGDVVIYQLTRLKQGVAEEDEKKQDPVASTIIDFYQNVGDIQKQPVDNYVSTAKEMLGQVDDPKLKSKLLNIFKQAKENPYVQGGVVTTIGALLAGGVLSSAQKMGLSPAQTNLALQAILNTVIPTVVSRINGKSWSDTIKYTLASAGIGTGIAGIMEEDEGTTNEAVRSSNLTFYISLVNSMSNFIDLITSTMDTDARDDNAKQEIAMMQQQFRKPIVKTMDFEHVASNPNIYQNPEVSKIVLKYIYDLLIYIETEIKRCVRPDLQSKWMNQVVQMRTKYTNAERQMR